MKLKAQIHSELQRLKKNQSLRTLKRSEVSLSLENDVINLSTNDYLGLASDENLLNQFYKSNSKLSLSSSSSRLLSGNHQYYQLVEDQLSQTYQSEAALFFNSGYHLNIGVLPALSSKKDLILADKFVHASLIEGFKLSAAKVIRYKHLDYQQLESLLEKNKDEFENIFIVSESVFSMDGDIADIKKLVELKQQFGAYLYIDEAHAVGVYGTNGLGVGEQDNLLPEIDFLVGTMGKALASIGAFLICSNDIKSLLVNTCRSLIYTTALPPINVAWSLFILKQIESLKEDRKELLLKSNYFRKILKEKNIKIVGNSHILGLILGDNQKCLQLSAYLEEHHIKVQAIRPPTVPEGTSRIRLSLNSKITYEQLDKVAQLIIQYEN